MSDYFWIIWLRTGDTSILSQQLRGCIFERSEEIERVNLMALGSGRINEASPQLWFSRNVSIGDSPTSDHYFLPISRFKGETIAERRPLFDLISYDQCLRYP